MGNNVCKTLTQKVVLYAVFVDSDDTHPWTEFDINSTLDSINVSVDWLERKAAENGITLSIQLEYSKRDGKIPVKKKFKYETLSGTLFKYTDLRKGINLVDDWSNDVSRVVAKSFPKDTSTVISTNKKANNRERLIGALRNYYKTNDVAVMYFINNYYENEISVAFHMGSDEQTEYAVVSAKTPPVIAHEFLHIFGALDLYISPFDKKWGVNRKKRRAMRKYPNEIMAFSYKRNIESLELSPLTKYLIGWDDSLDKKEVRRLVGRRFKLIEY